VLHDDSANKNCGVVEELHCVERGIVATRPSQKTGEWDGLLN
jgi:hypothetical protein